MGSSGVRITWSGGSGQSSPGASGITHGSSVGLVPCLTQSWSMNCSHDAISALPVVAGMIPLSRVISRRLISRGLGSRIRARSGQVASIGTLRPNLVPAIPISPCTRSFQLPSGVRSVANRSSNGGGCTASTAGSREVSTRFSWRRVFRMPIRFTRPSGSGRSYHGRWWSILSTAESNARSKMPGSGFSSEVLVVGSSTSAMCLSPGDALSRGSVSHILPGSGRPR